MVVAAQQVGPTVAAGVVAAGQQQQLEGVAAMLPGARSWPQSCARHSRGTPPSGATVPDGQTRCKAVGGPARWASRPSLRRGPNAGRATPRRTTRRPVY